MTIHYYDNLTQDEVDFIFARLNKGKTLSAIELTRVKVKSLDKIREIGRHELFKRVLTEKAFNKYTNEDIVIKSYAVLQGSDTSLETADIRPLMEQVELTEKDIDQLTQIYDRILKVYELIEDKKIAKRLLTRTHLVSTVPIVWRSIKEGVTAEKLMAWVVSFFCGKKSVSVSQLYNMNATSGSLKRDAVRKRLLAISDNYELFLRNYNTAKKYKF